LLSSSSLFTLEIYHTVSSSSHPSLFTPPLEDESLSSLLFNDLEGEEFVIAQLIKNPN